MNGKTGEQFPSASLSSCPPRVPHWRCFSRDPHLHWARGKRRDGGKARRLCQLVKTFFFFKKATYSVKPIIFNYCNFMVFITKMWLSVCHCAEAETVSSFRRLNKSSCFCHCATGKADVLVQEVWENKTAQQGQIVECLEFVVAASITELSRVYLCVCAAWICALLLLGSQDLVLFSVASCEMHDVIFTFMALCNSVPAGFTILIKPYLLVYLIYRRMVF